MEAVPLRFGRFAHELFAGRYAICIGRTPLDYDSWSRLIRIGFARIEYTDTPLVTCGIYFIVMPLY